MTSITFVVPPGATSQQQIVIELSGDGGMDRKVYPIRAAVVPVQAQATAAPTSGAAPLTVQFTGAASGGTGGYTFAWQFGDGGSSSEQNPAHTYVQAGTFNALLTVTDAAGATASAQVAIVVRDPGAAPGITCEQVDFVWAFSRREFTCAELGTGGMPYTDRDLALAMVPPELEATAWIRTANRDARRRSRWFLFLHTTEAVRVTVGFDAAARRLPIWLRRGWTDTGQTITLDNGRVMNLFSRDYEAGWIVLGSNRGPGARWQRRVRPLHYVVALSPTTAAPEPTDRFTQRRRRRRR
jgi:hypothetical protein